MSWFFSKINCPAYLWLAPHPGLWVPLAERHFHATGSWASESEFLLTCPMPSRCTAVNPGQSKCTDSYFIDSMIIWHFRTLKLLLLVSRLSEHCCLSVFVRRAGLLWSQQDFEWLWSVPLSSASLYQSFLLFCLICVYSSQFSILF